LDEFAPLPRNYILRITRDEWYRQVFTIKRYYPGVPRKWDPDGVIFLVRKTEAGDSIIGYGVIERFVKRDLLTQEKKLECEKMGWKGELIFKKLYHFKPPLPIKETILSGSPAKGRCFHGYPLDKDEVDSIMRKVRETRVIYEVK
jgi:hypothetical protein